MKRKTLVAVLREMDVHTLAMKYVQVKSKEILDALIEDDKLKMPQLNTMDTKAVKYYRRTRERFARAKAHVECGDESKEAHEELHSAGVGFEHARVDAMREIQDNHSPEDMKRFQKNYRDRQRRLDKKKAAQSEPAKEEEPSLDDELDFSMF